MAARSQTGRGHLFWLDWVRFIAAFMVVAIHARGGTWVEWGRLAEAYHTKLVAAFFAFTRGGTEFVLVFFVLSGFLVGGKVVERVEAGTFNLRDYAIDRVSRIWVPLVPALIWSGIVAYWLEKPVSWAGLGGSLLGLNGLLCDHFASNIPLWSLAYEVWFYLLAGAAAIWATKPAHRLGAGIVVAVIFAAFTKLRAVFLFAWLLGAMSYCLCHRVAQYGLVALGAVLVGIGFVCTQLRTATGDSGRWGAP